MGYGLWAKGDGGMEKKLYFLSPEYILPIYIVEVLLCHRPQKFL